VDEKQFLESFVRLTLNYFKKHGDVHDFDAADDLLAQMDVLFPKSEAVPVPVVEGEQEPAAEQ
jgi:hypothetical protein